MPTYDYICEKCNNRFEHFQKISDKDIDVCKVCSKGKVKKLISSSGFRLKGSGWYETDFKKKKSDDKPKSNTSEK